ncbi:MAG: DegT/DnrJ/EryC1/StrS family aminotransferase [Acidobacteria bacterium]|nr:DegT/DnrJ/EryC1/StrS family aminotransferase [Acidobacteriota bacterium]
MSSPSTVVPIARPTLPPVEELQQRLAHILSGTELTNGAEVARFEGEAAEVLEAPHCVAVSSCTAGLMLVERCLSLRGAAVTPSFTFFATAHSLLWNGLRPVLADCDPTTFQIDPNSVRRVMTRGCSAIVGVHLFGCPAPIDELEKLAREAGVALIFDGAHALGARWQGESVAGRGDATVYSLSPTKQMTCGEGGLITTRHAELARDLRKARNYGKGEAYDCDLLGLNARMTEIQAAIARASLARLEAAIARRRYLADLYAKRLRDVPGVRLQRIPSAAVSSHKDFGVLVERGVDRDQLMRDLAADGIETRAYFDPPLHRQKLYRPYYRPQEEALRTTDAVSRHILCIPIHGAVTDEDAARIADRITELVGAQIARSMRTPMPLTAIPA